MYRVRSHYGNREGEYVVCFEKETTGAGGWNYVDVKRSLRVVRFEDPVFTAEHKVQYAWELQTAEGFLIETFASKTEALEEASHMMLMSESEFYSERYGGSRIVGRAGVSLGL